MSGETVPTVGLDAGTSVPAMPFSIRVVPMDSGNLLIVKVDGVEHTLRLTSALSDDLAELLRPRNAGTP